MAYWLLKTEPGEYSYDDLAREKSTHWSGVSNALALKHMRAARKGDSVLIYHTGQQKQVVGVGEVASDPCPDPADSKSVTFVVKARRKLPNPVTLASIKADPRFKDFALVRISRLSVMPVDPALWKLLLAMGGL